jgi:hypothetical protein
MNSELIDLFGRMSLIRGAEERRCTGKTSGSVRLIASIHRHYIAKSGDVSHMFAEFGAKRSVICFGMGRSMPVDEIKRRQADTWGQLEGRNALVAGAGSGIGLEAAVALVLKALCSC